jgi:enoyl-CoA hydratase/carnithine racemase
MTYQTLLVETPHDGVLLVRLNRPEALNALNSELLGELGQVLDAAESDATVRCLVLTGSEKAFAAGADIKEMSDKTYAEMFKLDFFTAAARRIETFRKPIIAAVSGYALGGGCELALACTFRLVADTARLGLPETSLGLIPGFGGTQRLARAIGRQQALELILTGRQVDADEAVRLGLALRAVPAATLMDAAQALAAQLAARAPVALRYAREAMAGGLDRPLADGLAAEARLFGLAAATADMREGVRAFLEKRQAVFTGR